MKKSITLDYLLMLSIQPLMKRLRNWRRRQQIKANERYVEVLEQSIKGHHLLISKIGKRNINLHNQME